MRFESSAGVSETLGYAMILGIVLSFIGLAYGIYLPHLSTMQRSRYLQNMEHAFYVFAENLDRIASDEAPAKDLQFRLAGGSLSVMGDGWINLSWRKDDGSLEFRNISNLYTFIFRLEDFQVVYQSGAIFSISGSFQIPYRSPRMLRTPSKMMIPVMIASSPPSSIGGEGIFWVELEREEIIPIPNQERKMNLEEFSNISQLNITMESRYCLGWRSLMISLGMDCGDLDPYLDCQDRILSCNLSLKGDVSILTIAIESRIRA